jgi:hypothetical protein
VWGGWFGPTSPPFFVVFFYGRNRDRNPKSGESCGGGNEGGEAAVDGCGGDDYGGDAEMSGGGG